MKLLKLVCDIPTEFIALLETEADLLLSNPDNKKRFYRPFGITLSKQYPVNKYSVTDYKQESIDRLIPLLNWIKSIYTDHEFFQIQINSMDPDQRYPVHVDAYLFHQYSTRLHIGIKNNDRCEYLEFHKDNDTWNKKIYTIENFKLYEFDNSIPHSVHNKNNSCRVNIIMDIMHKEILYSRDDWKDLHVDNTKMVEDIENEFIQIPDLYKYTLKSFRDFLLKNQHRG